MPYFVDGERNVVVASFKKTPPKHGRCFTVDDSLAAAYRLRHGVVLTTDQVQALRDGVMPPVSLTNEMTSSNSAPSAAAGGSRQRAHSVAGVVEGCSWAFLIMSLLAGVIVAATTTIDSDGQQTHPYVAAGIGLAVAGSFQALVVIMLATYIMSRTEETKSGSNDSVAGG